jgi:hypothetical protein
MCALLSVVSMLPGNVQASLYTESGSLVTRPGPSTP